MQTPGMASAVPRQQLRIRLEIVATSERPAERLVYVVPDNVTSIGELIAQIAQTVPVKAAAGLCLLLDGFSFLPTASIARFEILAA